MAFIARHKKIVKNVGRGAITVVSAAVIAALFVLNYFAHNTAGANHYVYFNKLEYAKTILSPTHLHLYGVMAIVLALACVLRLALVARRGSLSVFWGSLSAAILVATSALISLCAYSSVFSGLLVWAYFIFVLCALEILGALLSLLSSKNTEL